MNKREKEIKENALNIWKFYVESYDTSLKKSKLLSATHVVNDIIKFTIKEMREPFTKRKCKQD